MNLKSVRKWLVEESGKYHLVVDTTSWADNGANAYINAGQMMLDDRQKTVMETGINTKILAAGENLIQIPNCRAVKEVKAIRQSDGSIWSLTPDNRSSRILYGFDDVFPSTETGTPRLYKSIVTRAAPEASLDADIANIPANFLPFSTNAYLANGILITPIANADYLIQTTGLFYTPALVEDEDENYWSYLYPHVLVMAAQCIMEQFSRNTEGVKDWLASIDIHLRGIDNNLVEQELAAWKESE